MMMKKLMKRALLLLIAAVMLFQMIPVAIAGEPLGDREDEEEKGGPEFWIVCRPARLMQEPSTTSALLTTVPAGTQLKILGQESGQTPAGPEDGRWSRVSYGGKTGYVRNWFLCRKTCCYRITRDATAQIAGSNTVVVLKKGDFLLVTLVHGPVGVPNARVMSGTEFGRSVYVGEKVIAPVK